MFGEFESGGDSALVELRDELPDREHRLRRSASRMEFVGDGSELGDVDRGVVVLTEIVLEGLEPADERLSRRVVQQAGETLEQIPQLLRILAEVVNLLGR